MHLKLHHTLVKGIDSLLSSVIVDRTCLFGLAILVVSAPVTLLVRHLPSYSQLFCYLLQVGEYHGRGTSPGS